MQEDASKDEYVPKLHSEHEVAIALENVPASQEVHNVDPMAPLYVPVSQSVHPVLLVAPEYVPSWHNRH